MSKNKIFGSLTIIFFTLLILSSTAAADELELKLFKSKAKASLQLTQAQSNQYTNVKFGLRIMGGCALFMRNDINEHLQTLKGFIYNFEVKPLNIGLDISGELFINFTSDLGIAIGTGYILADRESSAKSGSGEHTDNTTYHPKFSAVPVTLTCYYRIPLGRIVDVVFNAGLGYYLSTVNYDYFHKVRGGDIMYEKTETWSAKSNSLGFHGGINFEFGFTSNLAFVIGVRGRYAKLTDLTGDLDWVHYRSWSGWSSGTEEDQTLWFGIRRSSTMTTEWPYMILSEDKPSHYDLHDARKAEINLSGIIFQAGIKVTF